MQAELYLGLMRRFPGYTLSQLLAEDALLIQLLKIEALGGGPEDYAQ